MDMNNGVFCLFHYPRGRLWCIIIVIYTFMEIIRKELKFMQIRKVTLIGLGSMGAFFAPGLDAYLGRGNFRVLAEGERRERLRSRGVTINGVPHFFDTVTPEFRDDPADVIIIAVKDTGLSQAIEDIRNQVGPETQILCVLNGVDSEERVAAVYGWEHVLYSYMRVSINMRDGAADFDPSRGKVHFGEAKNDILSERVLSIQELFDKSGIGYSIEPDMIRGIWFKFMCNVGENLTCALLGVPFGAFRVSEHVDKIRLRAMREVMEIANKLGIDLRQEDIDRQAETIRTLPFANKPSTLQDLELGRKTEIDMFAGRVVELGLKLGVETPVSWMFLHAVKALEEKNEGIFRGEMG